MQKKKRETESIMHPGQYYCYLKERQTIRNAEEANSTLILDYYGLTGRMTYHTLKN